MAIFLHLVFIVYKQFPELMSLKTLHMREAERTLFAIMSEELGAYI